MLPAERARGKAVIRCCRRRLCAVGMGDRAVESVECDGVHSRRRHRRASRLLYLLRGAVLDIRRGVSGRFLKYCRVDALGDVRAVYIIGVGGERIVHEHKIAVLANRGDVGRADAVCGVKRRRDAAAGGSRSVYWATPSVFAMPGKRLGSSSSRIWLSLLTPAETGSLR